MGKGYLCHKTILKKLHIIGHSSHKAMNKGPKFKYMVINYVIDTADDSTIAETRESMQLDMNGWGEGQWEVSSIIELKSDGALVTLMVTYKYSQHSDESFSAVELSASI